MDGAQGEYRHGNSGTGRGHLDSRSTIQRKLAAAVKDEISYLMKMYHVPSAEVAANIIMSHLSSKSSDYMPGSPAGSDRSGSDSEEERSRRFDYLVRVHMLTYADAERVILLGNELQRQSKRRDSGHNSARASARRAQASPALCDVDPTVAQVDRLCDKLRMLRARSLSAGSDWEGVPVHARSFASMPQASLPPRFRAASTNGTVEGLSPGPTPPLVAAASSFVPPASLLDGMWACDVYSGSRAGGPWNVGHANGCEVEAVATAIVAAHAPAPLCSSVQLAAARHSPGVGGIGYITGIAGSPAGPMSKRARLANSSGPGSGTTSLPTRSVSGTGPHSPRRDRPGLRTRRNVGHGADALGQDLVVDEHVMIVSDDSDGEVGAGGGSLRSAPDAGSAHLESAPVRKRERERAAIESAVGVDGVDDAHTGSPRDGVSGSAAKRRRTGSFPLGTLGAPGGGVHGAAPT